MKQDNATFTVGVLSRLSPEKGVSCAIRALHQASQERPGIRMLIAGDGEERAMLEKLAVDLGIKSSVTFLGWIDDKQAFFDDIDIFCLPSEMESFGLTVLEAMHHGVPVVATSCDGPRDILSHGVNGLLCWPYSSHALAVAFARLADDNDLRMKLAGNAKVTLQSYRPVTIGKRIEAVLRKACGSTEGKLCILNITYNKVRGGVEQAFVDYTAALIDNGHVIHCLTQPHAGFLPALRCVTPHVHHSRFLKGNIMGWLLKYRLCRLIRRIKPDVVLYHNARNIDVVAQACDTTNVPLVVVSHGGKLEGLAAADFVIAVNSTIAKVLPSHGSPAEKITVIGNMIRI